MLSKIVFCFQLLVFSSIAIIVSGQDKDYPQDYFGSPLDIPLYLAGSFGELRSNHFHAGIDIKTQGVQGKNVHAVADGYVSRIKVSPYGYGNALYITHPNGYTSVYGHLQKFNKEIDDFVKTAQYHKESFGINLFPNSSSLKVKNGDVIAKSGNSGGSAAPHLHFEIRETKTEYPINPLFFGFDIKDEIKPTIAGLALYPINENSTVKGKSVKTYYYVEGSYGNYSIKNNPLIEISGKIGIGVSTYDKMNLQKNRVGIYTIQLEVDGETEYQYKMDKFGFHQTRYMNCHIDFEKKIRSGKYYQKCFVDDGNRLDLYPIISKPILNFSDTAIHDIKITVKDNKGNTATLKFKVRAVSKTLEDAVVYVGGDVLKTSDSVTKIEYSQMLYPNQINEFDNSTISLTFPANSLYDTLAFHYKMEENEKFQFSDLHHVHNKYTPVHKRYTISIKPKNLNEDLQSKALIAGIDGNGNKWSQGGGWENDMVTTKTRVFGNFYIDIDTIPPKIKPLNIYENKDMGRNDRIKIRIKDNFSGIKSYKGTIDGKWVLMEYDAKNSLLTHYFDTRTATGEHTFVIKVIDKKGNSSKYSVVFNR